MHLEKQGYTVHSPTLRPNLGIAPLAELANRVQEYIEGHIPVEAQIHCVGYSMGGIILRHLLQKQPSSLSRTLSFTTLASPHNGSINAWLAPLPGWVDLRPSSEFIANLEDGDHLIQKQFKPLSLWTPLDLVILPQNSSVWSIAQNEKHIVSMHPNMIRNKQVLARISQHFDEADKLKRQAA